MLVVDGSSNVLRLAWQSSWLSEGFARAKLSLLTRKPRFMVLNCFM